MTSLEVRSYAGAEAITRVRDIWEALQHHPNSDYEHFLLICRLRTEVIAPFALGIWQNGRCRALIAGRFERLLLRPSIGYARLPGVPAKVLSLVHEGILGELDADGAEALIDALDTMLEHLQADAISYFIPPESRFPLWSILQRHQGRALGLTRWTTHRELTLQEAPGFLLRNMRSKHRSWIRRQERKLAEAFPEEVHWAWHAATTDIPRLCARMESVARMTYQRGLGVGFVDNEENRQRLALFAHRGQMRVLVLEIHDTPKAYWLGTVYGGVFHSEATGYTTEMAEFEVGTLTFLRLVDELVKEGVTRFDFGLGDAHYKERFADRSWQETRVHVFSRSFKGQLLRGYLEMFGSMDDCARRVFQRFGVFDRIKQAWRAQLRQ